MSNYVDGFVIPLPKNNLDDYKRLAESASKIWKEHGALDYWECIGDDLEVKDMTSFMKIVDAGPNDTVVFAWIVFESREHRDEVNAKVMADSRLKGMCDPANQPFDYRKMAYGGFKTLVHA